jgi:hypothetical protein
MLFEQIAEDVRFRAEPRISLIAVQRWGSIGQVAE